MKKVLVLGSISTDFVSITDTRPNVGETVEGRDFFTTFGGKGANQAVAAARLEADVTMLGNVGDDSFADSLIKNLKDNNIETSYVEPVTHISSGAALITICDNDNSIVYVPGANGKVNANYVSRYEEIIKKFDIVVCQNEVPEDAIEKLIEIAHNNNIPSVMNPAPYRKLKDDLIEKITYLIPNESECKLLYPNLSIEEAIEKNPNKLIVTMGSDGVLFNDGKENIKISSYKVQALDTTGAGDTFIGSFATAISNGMDLNQAIDFANLSASHSVTKMGAQGGMPELKELKKDENFNSHWTI
ncbi:ribokinase [Peptostreptococcus equinus]|uniref:Ribokinase n=1 Tax=Peptostreptococcus equinus TaxID=3003601 RepID=A0ABY7JR20_9FIRM|nr:ribokinase [Peptostreptococcus sp. CBA3647]WAW14956.1 ribokinase [Peptostreptococcus sp. CBA3647]